MMGDLDYFVSINRGYYMPAGGYEFYLRVVNSISHSFKGAIYYVTITTVLSSRVKITCYLHV